MRNWVSVPWLTHERKKQKRKLAGFGNKLFLWTFSIGLWYNCCTSIKSPSAYWLGSSASGISFKLSTCWAYKSSLKVQFQKPLLVTRAASACSFIRLVCACLLSVLFKNHWLLELLQESSWWFTLLSKCLKESQSSPVLILPLESLPAQLTHSQSSCTTKVFLGKLIPHQEKVRIDVHICLSLIFTMLSRPICQISCDKFHLPCPLLGNFNDTDHIRKSLRNVELEKSLLKPTFKLLSIHR